MLSCQKYGLLLSSGNFYSSELLRHRLNLPAHFSSLPANGQRQLLSASIHSPDMESVHANFLIYPRLAAAVRPTSLLAERTAVCKPFAASMFAAWLFSWARQWREDGLVGRLCARQRRPVG